MKQRSPKNETGVKCILIMSNEMYAPHSNLVTNSDASDDKGRLTCILVRKHGQFKEGQAPNFGEKTAKKHAHSTRQAIQSG
ncbi:hypothetical protein TNCV_737541 [Trichonephila clavipes]|nr:hypothetical protein TNCV_737541 [Trichonephila clavipes]